MASKTVYLVDTENVGTVWKDLLVEKAPNDRILLFYTDNSPHISYPDLELIIKHPDKFEMIKCNQGKNGLDFQLVSYLGYLLKSAAKTNYVIISNDVGYDAVTKFWIEREYSVSRQNVNNILQAKKKAAASSKKSTNNQAITANDESVTNSDMPISIPDESIAISELEAAIRSFLPESIQNDTDTISKITEIINTNDLSKLQMLHRAFVKEFGNVIGTELYRTMRPHLANLKK